VPNLINFYEEQLRPKFEVAEPTEEINLVGRSDSQKMFTRLIKQAFLMEASRMSIEVAEGPYQVDIVLSLNCEEVSFSNIAIEVSDSETKDFRTHYPTPGHRIRNRFLKSRGYTPFDISTSDFPKLDTESP
jgi:hypothetical protein